MNRRKFISKSSIYSVGFIGLRSLVSSIENSADKTFRSGFGFPNTMVEGYGPLRRDPAGILRLPKKFSYRIISKRGTRMSDGFLVPGLGDGMATFPGAEGRVVIIRNHEVSPKDILNGPFGRNNKLFKDIPSEMLYDAGRRQYPCLGGTTTMIYDPKRKRVEKQFLSLAGTIRNCAGGPTPWNSWISCEENVNRADKVLEKDHGYNFEVPATAEIGITKPVPLKEMGRFNHEAVCVDPRTKIVYQTEDRPDGLIYRFISNSPGNLEQGGKLQILAIQGKPGFDTRNWSNTGAEPMMIGKKYQVEWLDIDEVESPKDDLRYRGVKKGAAVFARGEGMWYGDNELYFACTNGGRELHGQIFRYTPSPNEAQQNERNNPGSLEIFVEPNDSELVESCDNVTIGMNGDLVICEDKDTPRIVGITPSGKIYHIAKNVGHLSEFAGAVFSPDGKTLFVNIQGPGLTLAITGPWDKRIS